jgi:hypothetical protein
VNEKFDSVKMNVTLNWKVKEENQMEPSKPFRDRADPVPDRLFLRRHSYPLNAGDKSH